MEAPECVSWAAGRIDCFVRSSSGRLTWSFSQKGKWSAPRDLGGVLASAPSCIVRGPQGINCFAISAKGMLATIALNGSTWSKWGSLGGPLKPSRVSCVGLGRDRIACFALGSNGALMQRTWNGGKVWDPWRNLGGALSSDPECVAANASPACFGRSATGELAAYFFDATGRRGGWASLGARIEGKPSCVRPQSGEATCVAQGLSGRLQIWRGMAALGAGGGITTSSDDVTAGDPACALQGHKLVCFTRDAQRQLTRRTIGAGGDTSRDGVLASPAVAGVQCLSLGNEGLGCIVADTGGKLHYASGQALEAGTVVEPSTAADEEAQGVWFLTNLSSGAMCRAHLGSEGGKRLRLGPRCRRLGVPGVAVQWDQAENTLLFLNPDGSVALRFHSTQTGRWISPRRSEAFMLSRETPEGVSEMVDTPAAMPATEPPASPSAPPIEETPSPAPQPSAENRVGEAPDIYAEMTGSWRVFSDESGFVCSINLSELPGRRGLVAFSDDACDSLLPPIDTWRDAGQAMLLFSPNGRLVARFDAVQQGRWRAENMGGITLTR